MSMFFGCTIVSASKSTPKPDLATVSAGQTGHADRLRDESKGRHLRLTLLDLGRQTFPAAAVALLRRGCRSPRRERS
jgi:hypothetical protein